MIEKVLEYYEIKGIKEKEKRIREYMRILDMRGEWAGLTSKGFKEGAENAVIDSLGTLSILDSGMGKDVVDIGSGGGIVGVVMSIVCQNWGVTMVESSARKAAFLAEVIGSLGLSNARVERERAENIADRISFDVALGRATGKLRDFAPTAIRLLRTGGLYVAIKGSNAETEVKDAVEDVEASGGKILGVEKPDYPDEFGIPDRVSLVLVRKI